MLHFFRNYHAPFAGSRLRDLTDDKCPGSGAEWIAPLLTAVYDASAGTATRVAGWDHADAIGAAYAFVKIGVP